MVSLTLRATAPYEGTAAPGGWLLGGAAKDASPLFPFSALLRPTVSCVLLPVSGSGRSRHVTRDRARQRLTEPPALGLSASDFPAPGTALALVFGVAHANQLAGLISRCPMQPVPLVPRVR